MQTYTHFLWALALSKPLSKLLESENYRLPPFRRSAFLFGSILPDLPLIVTTIIFIIVDKIRHINLLDKLFKDWYFHNIWVKAEHNLFHSQVTLNCMLLGTYLLSRRYRCIAPPSCWFFWTLCSAWFHATCDIPVHHDDGPLIFFPFSTEYRFRSPLSYWDPNFHGHEFAICEHIVDVLIILWQCWKCFTTRRRRAHVSLEDDVKEIQGHDDPLSDPLSKQTDVELAALVP